MKIEMCESLMQSYLKYEKHCFITQLNWKVPTVIQNTIPEKARTVFEKIQKIQDFADIFKGCSLKQVLKQAELDVIGINGDTVYLVEVAFHENGLQYGDATETKTRVLKKLVRAYLIGLIFFPGKDYEIIFASPKVIPSSESLIKDVLPVLEKSVLEYKIEKDNVHFHYITNDKFEEEILIPTLQSSVKIADTSDLFLRSVRLLELFGWVEYKKSVDSGKEIIKKNNTTTGDTEVILIPANPEEFKRQLLKVKKAKRTLVYKDGSIKEATWNASDFKEASGLMNNIKSTSYWRNRKKNGLSQVILKIEESTT